MEIGLLYRVNEGFIQLLVFALLIAAGDAGYRLGRRAAASTAETTKKQISVIEGSLVGVLGLLLAFTMSMAVSRYEARKQLVLEEANAIGTSFLRTQLLPEPEGTEIARLLRQYVDLRIQYVSAGEDLGSLERARRKSAELQCEFWARAVAYGRNEPNPVRAGLLLQSLNQVIDLDAARWMAFFDHVPEAVIYLDALVALVAAMLVGYAFGIECVRHSLSMYMLGFAITVVLGVIIDLDRPRQGIIQVSQQPMLDLQRQLRMPAR